MPSNLKTSFPNIRNVQKGQCFFAKLYDECTFISTETDFVAVSCKYKSK